MKQIAYVLSGVLWLVSNNVWAACTVVVQPVLFGNYDVFNSTPLDSTGLIDITCDSVADTYTIALSAGIGSYSQRKMMNGSHRLDYNLYADSGHTLIWGDGTAGTSLVNGSGLFTSFSVYGLVPALQLVHVGNYTDNLVVTVTF